MTDSQHPLSNKFYQQVDAATPNVSVTCPHCGHKGSFVALGKSFGYTAQTSSGYIAFAISTRVCPNPSCSRPVIFVTRSAEPLAVYPPLRLDFDASGVPQKVRDCLEEAITCHSVGAHRAAALMVRRTLEELCQDRGAEGDSLQKRIKALGDKLVMPKELFDAVDDLRLLGNDAAHIEARIYEEIGVQETEVAIEVTKEILKAAYQYSNLVSKLKALQTPKSAEGATAA